MGSVSALWPCTATRTFPRDSSRRALRARKSGSHGRLAERDEYGARTDPEEEIRNRVAEASRYRLNERVRPDGRVIEIRQVPVAVGGFVIVLADITERKRNEEQI